MMPKIVQKKIAHELPYQRNVTDFFKLKSNYHKEAKRLSDAFSSNVSVLHVS